MDSVIWNEADFGLHNYATLINDAKARVLESVEDVQFTSSVRGYHSKQAPIINWGRGSLQNVVIRHMKGDAQNGDIYFRQVIEHLKLSQNELAWVGWHDQVETIEITVGKLLEYIVPSLFVGYGMIVMSVSKNWLIEYKFNDAIYAARCLSRVDDVCLQG